MNSLIYLGLTPQTSDINGLTAGQTIISNSVDTFSLTFSFESAQIKVGNASIPSYTDLKYGYSIASFSVIKNNINFY